MFHILRNADDVSSEPPLPPLQSIHARDNAGSGDTHLLHLRIPPELGWIIPRVHIVVVGERVRPLLVSLAAVEAGHE